MTRILITFALATLLSTSAATAAAPAGVWDRDSEYNSLYDSESIEVLKGTVSEVDRFEVKGEQNGICLSVEVNGEQTRVHLGPEWFLENQTLRVDVGDRVAVRGSRVDYQGESVILAAAVVRGDHMLLLRSPAGAPAWAAWQKM